MTLRQLEFLIGIADLGSISACAEYYGVSQPAVTNQIRQLEAELATALLIRNVHGATLTDSGRRTVAQAKRVLQEVHRIPMALEASKQSLSGKIVLGVSPLSPVSVHHFPRIYRPFHKAFPDVQIDVVELEALNLTDQVAKSRVDLALTPLPMFTTKVQYELLWAEELVVISSADGMLDDSVSMTSLQNETFVFMKPGYSLNLTTARLAQQAGFEPKVVVQASSLHALLGFVSAGIGIAIVPRDAVLLEARAGFINISRLEPRAYRRFALVYRNQPDMSPEVTMFMNYIRSYSDEFPRYRRHVLDHALRTNKKIHLER
ncbi:MAG: LysR family transcriptional regulator [Firmicutes bacterium]|nr:LysR family transcriptional regulator [Bacillota bacterium]